MRRCFLTAAFRRQRRPGDFFFALVFLAFALFLLASITSQTGWKSGGKLVAQPRFWPAVSLGGMALFALLHLIGSAVSEREFGRWREVGRWLLSFEFAGWFIAYAALVPLIGYLPSTLLVSVLLVLRSGYRDRGILVAMVLLSFVIVVVFRGVLQVKLPSGAVYDYLPDGIRQIFFLYF